MARSTASREASHDPGRDVAYSHQPHPHSMMTSQEVDTIVHSYLVESGYIHTSFSLLHEAALPRPSTSHLNGRKHRDDSDETHAHVPPGHLVRILQKGLLYLEAEARYRGDPPEPAPRLVGYPIPNALPLPPLPKDSGASSTPPPPPTPGPSTVNGASSAPPPATSNPAPTSTAKDKGKAKETTPAPPSAISATSNPTTVAGTKRKGRTGSDRDELAAAEGGKRARTGATDRKRKSGGGAASKKGVAAVVAGEPEDSSMDLSDANSPAGTAPTTEPGEEKAAEDEAPPFPPLPTPSESVAAPKMESVPSNGSKKTTSPPPSPPPAPAAPAEQNTDRASLPPLHSTSELAASTSTPEPAAPADLSPSSTELAAIKKEEAEALLSTADPAPLTVEEAEDGEETEEGEVPTNDADGETTPPPSTKELSKDGDGDVVMDSTPLPDPKSDVVRLNGGDASVIKLKGHTVAKVQPCSWNPKVPALLATGGGDSTCRIWEVPTPPSRGTGAAQILIRDSIVCKHSSAQRRADVAAVAWDPSGSLLATGSEDGIARIWTPSGDLHLVLSMHQRTIFSLKWNSLGTMLLTGSLDNTVCLWELSSGKVKQQWSTHSDSVLDVDWNDDNTFASASMDKSIHLFVTSRVSPVIRFKGHKDEINVVKFSSCGTLLASCSDDHTVRIWSLRNIAGLNISERLTPQDEGRLVDEKERGGVLVLEGHTKDVHTCAWAPWTKGQAEPRLLASASFDFTTKLWDADHGTCLYTFGGHTDFVYSVAFSPGLGTYLSTGSNDGKLCVWDLMRRTLILEYTNTVGAAATEPGPIYEIAWHPAATHLAVCGRTEDVAVVGFPAELLSLSLSRSKAD